MSLDINMKEIQLKKGEKDNWIYISKDGKEETTKLLYWDGEQNTECYKQSFVNIAVDSRGNS